MKPEDRADYPEKLSSAEQKLLDISRDGRGKNHAEVRNCTGIGLSGGGIRSATFCLGVFQGLASWKMLRSIDFISTVSGGGYFGSFYTRFFLRQEVDSIDFVEGTLSTSRLGSKADDKSKKDPYQRNILRWLRENGRYLSPRGSGDLLLFVAVLLRNWLVVQIVLVTFFLFLFLTAELVRIPIDTWTQHWVLPPPLPGLKLWQSPLVALPMILFLFWAVPTGWAYWLVGRQAPGTQWYKHPWIGLAAALLAAAGVTLASLRGALPDDGSLARSFGALLLIALLTAGWALWANLRAARRTPKDSKYGRTFQDESARHWTSTQLKGALVATVASYVLAILDTFGQTLYAVLRSGGLTAWAAGVVGALVVVVPFANRIMMLFGRGNGKTRPKLPVSIAAAVAAAVVIAVLLTAISVGANAIAWGGRVPRPAQAELGNLTLAQKLSDIKVVCDGSELPRWRMECKAPQLSKDVADQRNVGALWASWGATLLFSILFGQCWPFINRSTQQPLYSARLTRAYLGATNPRRFREDSPDGQEGGAVTKVIAGDDINPDDYWPWPIPSPGKGAEPDQRPQQIYGKGTPLHLVNVTINETVDGRSQIQQQDRKGTGMAFGPAGVSSGIRHHAVFERDSGLLQTFPEEGFRVFNFPQNVERGEAFRGEKLPLGQLVGISGAAFSTGIGARTSLAFSLLAGVANVRLGYWWDSGIDPTDRTKREKPQRGQWFGEKFSALFPVQSYLLDELTARFHGTARQHWYLSDGGHFENMGGYELIRRRLRLIIIVDAEADPDYTFEGLGNLVRKARIDFGAEIEFLDDDQLDRLPDSHRGCFRSPESLRRGKWIEEHLPSVQKNPQMRQLIDPVDHLRHSLAHASLATVRYDGNQVPESCLLYLKPTIVGNEPRDVLQYHVEHPTFPQETTMDQFFDESQWESYRTLGEHIAEEVFKPPVGPDGKPLLAPGQSWEEWLVQAAFAAAAQTQPAASTSRAGAPIATGADDVTG
jgi:hypothetical protein